MERMIAQTTSFFCPNSHGAMSSGRCVRMVMLFYLKYAWNRISHSRSCRNSSILTAIYIDVDADVTYSS